MSGHCSTIFILGILAGCCVIPFAADAGEAVPARTVEAPTPYDPHLAPLWKVLEEVNPSARPDLRRTTRLLRQGRSFRYTHRPDHQPLSPEVTGRLRSGDCKDKSLWLLQKLDTQDAHFVIGRHSPGSKDFHAWLYWKYEEEWFILDPTHRNRPVKVSTMRNGNYEPYFTYSAAGSRWHPAAMAASSPFNPLPSVAGSSSER